MITASSVRQARPPSASAAPPAPLRDDVAAAIERLARFLEQHAGNPLEPAHGPAGTDAPDLAAVRDRLRFLGQVASGWQQLPDDALPDHGAGFGSTVVVEDRDHGGRETYTLMTGALLDIDAGQVSLASPIGQALLGATAGSHLTVQTPQRQRRLRVVSVWTLRERVGIDGLLTTPPGPERH